MIHKIKIKKNRILKVNGDFGRTLWDEKREKKERGMRLLKKNPKWKIKGRKREKKFHGDQVVISSILLFTQWDFFWVKSRIYIK